MNLGPRTRQRRGLRRVVVLPLLASCLVAVSLLAVGRFASGSGTVSVGGVVILALSPTLAFGMGCCVNRGIRAARRIRRRREKRAMRPVNPPIEQIAADLRRMLRAHDGIVRTRHIATTDRRVRALEAAISTSAVQAALALEVSHPSPVPYSGLETSQLRRLLQALRAEGLVLPADAGLTQPDTPF
jgi:hypothetical protein